MIQDVAIACKYEDDNISRQAVIDILMEKPSEMNYGFYYVKKIKALPSVEKPERKYGSWSPVPWSFNGEALICSCCQGRVPAPISLDTPEWNFCPNCGADMRYDDDDFD